jgi:class 3 adenylate cyclase
MNVVAVDVQQPAGTVTLAFLDVEGSTRLLTRLGETEYREALAEFRMRVRAARARFGGFEVNHEGDEFFLAFGSAGDALSAVSELAARLAAGPVRVGVHTGEPGLDAPKYAGLDVHTAARVMAAAHGGQVVVSEATRRLVAGRFDSRPR